MVAPYAANKEEDEIEQNVDHQYYDALNVWVSVCIMSLSLYVDLPIYMDWEQII